MRRAIGVLSLVALLSALCTHATAADPPANRGEVQRNAQPSDVWEIALDEEEWLIFHQVAADHIESAWLFENGQFVSYMEAGNPLIVETLDPGNTTIFYELTDGSWLYVSLRFTGSGTLANANGERP